MNYWFDSHLADRRQTTQVRVSQGSVLGDRYFSSFIVNDISTSSDQHKSHIFANDTNQNLLVKILNETKNGVGI